MIKANISDIKNRLSYYLRLVKSGEEIEIIDRKTPLARIVKIDNIVNREHDMSWIKQMYDLGIVRLPRKKLVFSDFTNIKNLPQSKDKMSGVLNALLEERNEGR